jgi:hypothetical protein
MSVIIDKNVTDAAYQKWSVLAVGVPEASFGAPAPVIFGEAVDVAMLFNAYWQPTTRTNGPPLPGFIGVAARSAITENTGGEIYELQAAAGKLHAEYAKAVQTPGGSPMVRAEFVLNEVRATLEFIFDDDEHTLVDDQLEKLASTHSAPTSQDTMAVALEAYVSLAEDHREELTGIQGFDVAMLDEARALAGALRTRSGQALIGDVTTGIADLLSERNRLVALLLDRVNRVRRAARYVFRDHPEVARKFTSAYQRSRRQSLRRRKAAEAQGATEVNAT